jgi:hypothetical protein
VTHARILPATGLAAALLAAASCGGSGDERRGFARAPDAPGAAQHEGAAFDPVGTWTVVGHSMPGTSAVSEEEASAHDGQTLRLSRDEALSNGERCTAPRYPARSVVTEDFLATEFNLPPETLKPLEGRASITVVEVACGDAPWTPFGSLLIAIDADRALTPWDGVFYELKRTPTTG